MNENQLSTLKTPLLITAIIIIMGSYIYFTSAEDPMTEASVSTDIYQDMQIKTAYGDGTLKIFANAKNNELKKLIAEGDNLPEKDTIIIGYDESMLMKQEQLFTKTGDTIEGLFGIDTKVGGILAPTGTLIDTFHFLGETAYENIEGDDNKAFIRLNEGMPKLFYTQPVDEEFPIELPFAQGSFDNYQIHNLGGVNYYPIILGSKEAEFMRSEQLFKDPGNIIQGFFGKNVVIIGILEETKSPLDLMHISPLSGQDIA